MSLIIATVDMAKLLQQMNWDEFSPTLFVGFFHRLKYAVGNSCLRDNCNVDVPNNRNPCIIYNRKTLLSGNTA